MPKLGDPIRLNLELWDGATNYFIQAHLYDATDTELVGSPVHLTSIANGLYTNDQLMMPNTPEVKVVYQVFTDSGYSLISPVHSDAIDIFELETPSSSPSIYSDLVGIVGGQMNLTGSLESQVNLSGILSSDTLTGDLEQNSNLVGTLELEDEMTGITQMDTEMGTIKC
jgi:hypothetical protein